MQSIKRQLPTWLTIRRLVVLVLGIVALGWCAVQAATTWWYRAELERASREMASNQYDQASARLARLSSYWPGQAEVEFALGSCNAELGHIDLALTAWDRVPRRSKVARPAALARAQLALEHGRLGVAETSLATVVDLAGEITDEAGKLIEQLLFVSGRSEAIGRSIERRWGAAREQAKLLRTHWLVDSQPVPIIALRELLDRLHRENPNDDLIWLGYADVETRAGHYTEADQWLKRCEMQKHDNLDVKRARLSWALAAGHPDTAIAVLGDLPADAFSPREVAALEVQLAALQDDSRTESAALERLVRLDPGDAAAWERLAELAAGAGALDRVASLRSRKAEIDRNRDQYRKLMGSIAIGDLSGTADLARTAESLGRAFEARGWWTIRMRQAPDDRDARAALDQLSRAKPTSLPAKRTLADVLAGSKPAIARGPSIGSTTLAVPTFEECAAAAGLRFVYENDPTMLHRLPETMGGGLGLIDYDGDGWLDVYAVQGGKLRDEPAPSPAQQGDRLYHNKGDGTFEDVTIAAGLAKTPGGYGHGVAVGDYDNDGHPDLFVTRWRSYALYHNQGNGTFDDVTERSGLGGPRDWPTSAAFADLDGDGDLDLFVCHYLDWDPQRSHPCPDPDRPNTYLYCVPRGFEARPDHVFRNDGDRFVDVTTRAGIADRDGRGLGVVIADLDDDGRPDVFVANDMTANFLFHNMGNFQFEERGELAGVGSSGEGGYQAGMGIACGDLDGDGRLDLAVTNFYGESTSMFINLGQGLFADRTAAAGLRVPSRYVLGFGACFLDANNDGLLDLATANGHVNDYRPAIPYAMRAQLFLGIGEGRLAEVGKSAGTCWQLPHVGRGMAAGDIDNDGRFDLLFVAEGEPLAYFRNQGPTGHFVTLKLEGAPPGSNRDAVGARVVITAGGRSQVAQRLGGGSFLSASDDRLHFGLGDATTVEVVEVRWPSGRVDRYTDLTVDRGYLIREGRSHADLLPGWQRRSRSR